MALAEQSTVCNGQQKRLPCHSDVKRRPRDTLPVKLEVTNGKDKFCVVSKINNEGKTATVRKGLGCRRSKQDMLSSEDQQAIAKEGIKHQQGPLRRRQPPRKPSSALCDGRPRRRLIFTSPRLTASDEDLFPSNHSLYKQSNDRWQQISDQAGSHRQDGTVMNIGRKPSTAKTFRMGMIRCAAVRVRSLNLWVDHEKDTLLDWLEMIAETFTNLEHLTLTEDIFPGEDEMAVSARMRRLYVLSILPNLKSIDDMVVTSKERTMANPGSYSGSDCGLLSPSSESISTIESKPVLIDTEDTVRTCRANGIEVEFLSEKCWEVKESETETTASSSPTLSSASTNKTAGIDDHFAFEQQDSFPRGAISHDSISSNQVHSIDRKSGKSPICEDSTDDEIIMECVSTRERDTESGVSNTKICTLNSDANGSIELVPTATIGLESSRQCDVSDNRNSKLGVPAVQFPPSSEGTKIKIEAPITPTQKKQSPSLHLRNNETQNSDCGGTPSILKACTPVQRQSTVVVPTPQCGCCQILTNNRFEASQFSFPTSSRAVAKNKKFSQDIVTTDFGLSANQRLPPSKSLSSPFPMQFREKQKSSLISTTTNVVVQTSGARDCNPRFNLGRNCSTPVQNGIEVIARPHLVITPTVTSPINGKFMPKTAERGELPPTCPFGKQRRKMSNNFQPKTLQSTNLEKRTFHNVLKENARAASVMDLDDDEEEFPNNDGVDDLE